MSALSTRLVVLDFDGTVCLGDDPVLSYARHLDAALAAHDDVVSDGLILETIARFLEGPDVVRSRDDDASDLAGALEAVVDSADGYAASARLARSQGITADEMSAAYAASRRELADGELTTWAPEGLAAFLRDLPAVVVLVTNATETGVAQQLDHLGLTGVFDEIVTSAGKPDGMAGVLERLRSERGLAEAPERLLSVGDIWRNDLEPAAAHGSATALIERFAAPEARPTFRAASFEELYTPIAGWAAEA
jgi:FMN phosphatase YigB (HAD superfamily)